MLEAFIAYERDHQTTISLNQRLIHFPLGTRLLRVIREVDHWIVWTATRDFIFGTYTVLWDDGHVCTVTIREDEGDEIIRVRPSDEEISRWTKRSSGSSSTEV